MDIETFNKLLDEYRSNYVQFLSTGTDAYKQAYQLAQQHIETALTEKRSQVDKEKKDMKHFTESYAKDTNDLSSMYDSGTSMYKDADKLQDEFTTSKERYELWTKKGPTAPVLDLSVGYAILLRMGIVLLVLPILFVVGYILARQNGGSMSSLPNYDVLGYNPNQGLFH